jgi:DNA repair photolyase
MKQIIKATERQFQVKKKIILNYKETTSKSHTTPKLKNGISQDISGHTKKTIHKVKETTDQHRHFNNFSQDHKHKIIYQTEAPELLEKKFNSKNWKVNPILLSGNTDFYQPIERKLKITRRILEVCLKYRHPVSILTKYDLVQRDLDLLIQLAEQNLIQVSLSISSLDKNLRNAFDRNTTSVEKKLQTLAILSKNNIPTTVMATPIILGLNSHEIPNIVKKSAELGALAVSYNTVRLNGVNAALFENWIKSSYPDRANRVLNQIREMRNENLDSIGKNRMKTHEEIALMIQNMFKIARKKHLKDRVLPKHNINAFLRPCNQLNLF